MYTASLTTHHGKTTEKLENSCCRRSFHQNKTDGTATSNNSRVSRRTELLVWVFSDEAKKPVVILLCMKSYNSNQNCLETRPDPRTMKGSQQPAPREWKNNQKPQTSKSKFEAYTFKNMSYMGTRLGLFLRTWGSQNSFKPPHKPRPACGERKGSPQCGLLLKDLTVAVVVRNAYGFYASCKLSQGTEKLNNFQINHDFLCTLKGWAVWVAVRMRPRWCGTYRSSM